MSKGKLTGKSADSTATIGFEATALRDSALPPPEAILRSLSAAKDNLWLTADSRSVAEFAEGNRRLAVMNLALRGIEAEFGTEHADTFRRALHPDLRADTATRVSAKPQPRSHLASHLRSERQLLANPPFNDSDWISCDTWPPIQLKARL